MNLNERTKKYCPARRGVIDMPIFFYKKGTEKLNYWPDLNGTKHLPWSPQGLFFSWSIVGSQGTLFRSPLQWLFSSLWADAIWVIQTVSRAAMKTLFIFKASYEWTVVSVVLY